MPEPEVRLGKYLYCIIRSSESKVYANRGVGERGDPVHTIQYQDLAAIVSDSPIVEYDSSRRNMMAHTKVLEEVMGDGTILPVRFGMVAPSADAVQTMLQTRYKELVGMLGEIDGRVELGLKAFWFEDVTFREIVEEHAPIRQLRDSLMGRSPEETYYDRIQLGEMVEAAMSKKRDEDAQTILNYLEPLTELTCRNKTITDRMVLNAAFLVKRANENAFDLAVQQLDTVMGKRMVFKYVGSAPPYNFVNLVIHWK